MALLRRLLTGLRLARGTNAFEARALLGFGGQRWYWEAGGVRTGQYGGAQCAAEALVTRQTGCWKTTG